jgi:endonuclease YncB( thermonuclease family)
MADQKHKKGPVYFTWDLETGGVNTNPGASPSARENTWQAFVDAAGGKAYRQSAFYRQHYAEDGRPYQLLEYFAQPDLGGSGNLIPDRTWPGFRNTELFFRPQSKFAVSKFAAGEHGILARSLSDKARSISEEAFGQVFFRSLASRLKNHEAVTLSGWNGIFDLSKLEQIAHSYPSLKGYRGLMANAASKGNLFYEAAEEPFLAVALRYGKKNQEFAGKYFRTRAGKIASTIEEMREVSGWSAENVARPFGGVRALVGEEYANAAYHAALVDTPVASRLRDAFASVRDALDTNPEDWHAAFAQSDLTKGRKVDELFHSIFATTRGARQADADRRAGAKILENFKTVVQEESSLLRNYRAPLIGLGIASAAAISFGLAFGKRKDRQTQLEGLRHLGMSGRDRRENTDFGSGWRGLDEDSNHRAFGVTAAAAGLYGGHRWALRNLPEYAPGLYDLTRTIEERSPRRVLRTLGISQRFSQYLPAELRAGRGELFSHLGTNLAGADISNRTRFGDHLARLTPDINWNAEFLKNRDSELKFTREGSSPFQRLELNGKKTKYRVSFVESRGALALNSEQFDAPLGRDLASAAEPKQRGLKFLHNKENKYFSPYQAVEDGAHVGNVVNWGEREGFGLANRLNMMLHDVHHRLAIPHSAYNGPGTLVSSLLVRRVAPLAALVAGAGYLDYKLNHKPSNVAYDLYAKARVGYADATDTVPGARGVTDWYAKHVPGPQYGPLALPALGVLAGGLAHYSRVVSGQKFANFAERTKQFRGFAKYGAAIGAIAALPFLPGMLGSRKTADQVRSEFSGETPVAVRAGRWWQFGVSPLEGNRIKMYRPHQYVLHKTRAEDISLYGSEDEKWAHNPLLHPIRWFKDPNWLAKKHQSDRPYPITSPAFSNVPLIGPVLAATIGRVVAPPVRMHEGEWDGSDYTLYTKSVEPNSPRALAPEMPEEEFNLHHIAERAEHSFEEGIGLPGFLMRSAKHTVLGAGDGKPEVMFEGSREMTSWARRFQNLDLGGLPAPHAQQGLASYTEPFRRFIEGDKGAPRVNELQNEMPSWLPNGDGYFFDFHKGDVYSRVPYGSVRLPGAGYEALHPELAGLDPEEYPDIEKLRILGDVAPWSRSFTQLAAKLGAESRENEDTIQRIEYERITDRARRMRESTVRFSKRHTGPTEEIEGTVRAADDKEIQLEEYAGRYFSWSGVDGRAAALAADAIGLSNADLVSAVKEKKAGRSSFLADTLAPGTKVRLVLNQGGSDVTHSSAVVFAGGTNVNKALIDRGFGSFDPDRSGNELQAMDGLVGGAIRSYAEGLSFQGDQAWYNPMRLLPGSMHAKLWNQRTPLEAYINQEVSGTRMRRWQRPLHDFVEPYLEGAAHRLTGNVVIGAETHEKRDLDTLTDQLEYLRSLYSMSADPEHRGQHFLGTQRTSIGANLFGETDRLPQTLPSRERKFFQAFLGEADPDQRSRILATVSKEMADTLVSQWTKQTNKIRQATGRSVEEFSFSGRYVSQEDVDRATDLEGKVVKVIDGDSLRVNTNKGEREIRLANINTPEMIRYSGHVAKQMTEKLALGEHVRLHTVGEDKYGRTVADVFTDDKRLLNYELLNSGHAEKDVYQNADGSMQSLSVGDFFRAREIAQFFKRRGLALPSNESEVMASDIDYEDVKVKIVQWEGLDFHDFNIYDDRVAMLWRKPYLDGAVRELTAGDDRSEEEMTMAIERAIAQSKVNDRKPRVQSQRTQSRTEQSNLRVDMHIRPDKELEREVRRNADEYRA